jgi:hypothetical protein
MPDYTNNEYPANWHSGSGEGSRPLHEGGRYLHLYYRVLPGSNQHIERFLEMRVDTSGGGPPDAHHLELNYCTEDNTEVQVHKRLETRSVDVLQRDSQAQQEQAESEIHELAEELMHEYADWTPD